MPALKWCFVLLVSLFAMNPALLPAVQEQPTESVAVRLDRIRQFLETGSANQQAASLRQLREDIRIEDLERVREYLMNRKLEARSLRALRGRYEELVEQRIDEAESHVLAFEEARRSVLLILTDTNTEEDRSQELADKRERRDQERSSSHRAFERLLGQGVALAPVLWRRLEQGQDAQGTPSYHVDRFRQRLQEELLREVRWQYPTAPTPGSVSPFERRAMVPLITTLEEADSEGWQRFREDVARQALALFETFDPIDRDQARSIFLELSDWGVERLDRWVEDKDAESALPRALRKTYASWNRIAVPVGFAERTGLALDQYLDLPITKREELIHRIQWVGGRASVPVLNRLLTVEPEMNLRIEAAAVLSLHDLRGTEFLQRIGYEDATQIENVSRQVLLSAARNRRLGGDMQGALDDLRQLLRRYPGDFDVHYELGLTALLAKQYNLAVEHLRRAAEYDPGSQSAHYNLACALALAGQPMAAIAELQKAIDTGFQDLEHMVTDEDLESLWGMEEFKLLMNQISGG